MKLSRIFSSLFLIATSIFICIFTPHKAFAIGQWTSTGSMLDTILNQYFDPVPASGDPIVMLQNGKVFSNGSASLFGNVISLQQTYDPSTGQWTATSRENSIRQYVVPIVLNNGKVLVAGGANDNGSNVLRSCPNNSQWGGSPASELYDPSTNQWSYTPGLPVGVAFYTATKLLDGRVLIVGGVTCESDPQTITTATQIYDPSTGHWTRSGDAPKQVANGSGNNLAVLNDGRVLMIGSGNYDNQFTPSAESDLFDPSTGQWTRTGDLHVARFSGNLVKLQDGRVLLMSGNSGNAYTTDSEIFDPATGQWTETGAVNFARDAFGSVLLPDGRVLIAGGSGVSPLLQSEIYDPSSGSWSVDASLNDGHVGANLVQFSGGYLIAGGGDINGPTTTAEIYGLPNTPPVINSFSGSTINEGATYSATGSFTDPDSSTSWTATVDYGDGLGSQALTLSGTNFSLSHQYKDNGTYTVTVSVTDNQGATGTGTATVTVNNVAPPVGTISASTNPVQVNTATTASANFTDPGVLDTHTASWNWGDGNTTIGTVTETNGSGSVSDSHTYSSAGVYVITLTVTDKDGGAGTQTFQYISVYNPTSQGLFSAGQKYTSPAGAYTANTSLTGNVKFGLSYKYQGSVPTGTRQFSMDFNAANLHFNATTISSLVIANGMGTLTGTGTISGSSGTYNFLVTGSESANTIRIQITDSSNNVIYDTQPSAAATATPTTAVTGNVLTH